MSTTAHSVLILPGGFIQFYCKDGLSPYEVMNIQHFYNFGGNIKMVNCGVENEFAALDEAVFDMKQLMNQQNYFSQAHKDMEDAFKFNSVKW